MKCANCEYRKEIDAIEHMNGAPEWVCTQKHTECEDTICLLRMVIWQLNNMDENNDEQP